MGTITINAMGWGIGILNTPDHLKFGLAIVADVFVNRHGTVLSLIKFNYGYNSNSLQKQGQFDRFFWKSHD